MKIDFQKFPTRLVLRVVLHVLVITFLFGAAARFGAHHGARIQAHRDQKIMAAVVQEANKILDVCAANRDGKGFVSDPQCEKVCQRLEGTPDSHVRTAAAFGDPDGACVCFFVLGDK